MAMASDAPSNRRPAQRTQTSGTLSQVSRGGEAVRQAAKSSVRHADLITRSWMSLRKVPGWSAEGGCVILGDPAERRKLLNRKSAKASRLRRRCHILALEQAILAKEKTSHKVFQEIRLAEQENHRLTQQIERSHASRSQGHPDQNNANDAISMMPRDGSSGAHEEFLSSSSITPGNPECARHGHALRDPFDSQSILNINDPEIFTSVTFFDTLELSESDVSFLGSDVGDHSTSTDFEDSTDPFSLGEHKTPSERNLYNEELLLVGLSPPDHWDRSTLHSIFGRISNSRVIDEARLRTVSQVNQYIRESWGPPSRSNATSQISSPDGLGPSIEERLEKRAMINRKSGAVSRTRINIYLAELQDGLNKLEAREILASETRSSLRQITSHLRAKLEFETSVEVECASSEIPLPDLPDHIVSLAWWSMTSPHSSD